MGDVGANLEAVRAAIGALESPVPVLVERFDVEQFSDFSAK